VLVTEGFVFVHIPRTGGSFIQTVMGEHLDVLDQSDYTHTPYDELPERWRDLPAFCVIRNPWDWYVSFFHYAIRSPEKRSAQLRNPPAPGREGLMRDKRAVWEDVLQSGQASFDEAVTRLCTGDFDHSLAPMIRDEGIDLYSAFVRTIAGPGLDQPNFSVLRFERLRPELLRFLRTHSDPPKRLRGEIRHHPPVKDSRHDPYPAYYDDRLRTLVGERAAWLCERFGYEFESLAAEATTEAGDDVPVPEDAEERPPTKRARRQAQRRRGTAARAEEPAEQAADGQRAKGRARAAALAARAQELDDRGTYYDLIAETAPLVGVETESGAFVVATSDAHIGKHLFVKRSRPEFRVLRRAVTVIELLLGEDALADRLFLDVGANIGTSTICALLTHGFGSAVAFEPEEVNYRLLRANVHLNGLDDRVRCMRVGVSDEPGTANLVVPPEAGGHSWIALDADRIENLERSRPRRADLGAHEMVPLEVTEVEVIALNGLVDEGVIEPEAVGMLWIDAEGHEGHILRGATALADRGVPIVFEFEPANLDLRGGGVKVREVAESSYTHFIDLRRPEPDKTLSRFRLQPVAELWSHAERFLDPSTRGRHTDLLMLRLDSDQAELGAKLPELMSARHPEPEDEEDEAAAPSEAD
jgi:FkbM family methyltransferase